MKKLRIGLLGFLSMVGLVTSLWSQTNSSDAVRVVQISGRVLTEENDQVDPDSLCSCCSQRY
jgi:hypothetical protein